MIIPKQNILIKKSLFHNLQEYKDNNYPDSIFYHKNGKIYFELDLKNNYLWCDYYLVWNVFSNYGQLGYDETQCVIMNMLVQHTNWEDVIPSSQRFVVGRLLVQHTNWGDVTPQVQQIPT